VHLTLGTSEAPRVEGNPHNGGLPLKEATRADR
jgi:hypothetical protein